MQAYRILVKQAWGPWSDFRYETAASKKDAIIKAISDMDIPELHNDKICVTITQESPLQKKNKKRGSR